MPNKDFFMKNAYDFMQCIDDKEISGLKNGGFYGDGPVSLDDFDQYQLQAALDTVQMFFREAKTINRTVTSYGLKHLVERYLKHYTEGEINYISNGALILAMYANGYVVRREKDSPNCYFNITTTSIKNLKKYLNTYDPQGPYII